MTREKCAGCEFAGRAEACYAQAPGRGNLCRLVAAGRESYRGFVRWKTMADPDGTRGGAVATAASSPSLARQAVSLAGAVGRFVASGLERSTADEKARRMAICSTCEFFRGKRCSRCGCRLAYKVTMASEKCPIEKW